MQEIRIVLKTFFILWPYLSKNDILKSVVGRADQISVTNERLPGGLFSYRRGSQYGQHAIHGLEDGARDGRRADDSHDEQEIFRFSWAFVWFGRADAHSGLGFNSRRHQHAIGHGNQRLYR